MNARLVCTLAMAIALALPGCGGGIDVNVNASFPPARNTDFVAREALDIGLAGAGRTRLVLTGVSGRIAVTGAPAGNAIRVMGERRVGSDSLADAQAQLPQLQVQVLELGEDVVVATLQPQDSGGRSFVVDYEITVPSGLALHIAGVNGNIVLSQMNGSVSTSLVNGRTRATLQWPAAAVIDMNAVNGDIELQLPRATSALLSARVDIGTIVVQGLVVHDELRSGSSLQGRLGAGDGWVRLDTRNGSIRIDEAA